MAHWHALPARLSISFSLATSHETIVWDDSALSNSVFLGSASKNTANTNVIRHAGRILALLEGSPPVEVSSGRTHHVNATFSIPTTSSPAVCLTFFSHLPSRGVAI